MNRADRLRKTIKAYDVRGKTDNELDDDLLYSMGYGAAQVLQQLYGTTGIVIGHDMRPESPRFAHCLSAGFRDAGGDVYVVGLCSTDQLYYASGMYDLPGAMLTASHNPVGWNGIKFCGPKARGIGYDTGLHDIARAAEDAPELPKRLTDKAGEAGLQGTDIGLEVAAQYVSAIREQTGLDKVRPLHVVVDCGNGMAGKLISEVFGTAAVDKATPLDVHGLYTELDGTFPNHPANPLDTSTLVDVRRTVRERGADIGLAFDGDADRCFMIDERGEIISASAIGALVAVSEIERAHQRGHDSPLILHSVVTSRCVPEAVKAAGGRAMRTPVGHSGIKKLMREHGGIFGCEHSAHFYFHEFFGADSGMLAAAHVIAALSASEEPLSALVAEYSYGAPSGEINIEIPDPDAALQAFRQAAENGTFGEGEILDMDGVSLEGHDFWANVRKSNTEAVVRINCETPRAERTEELRTAIETVITKER